jgi:hypothetical protein
MAKSKKIYSDTLAIHTNDGIEYLNYWYKYGALDGCDFAVFYPKKKFNRYLLLKMEDTTTFSDFLSDTRTQKHINTLLNKLADKNNSNNEDGRSFNHSWILCLSPQLA